MDGHPRQNPAYRPATGKPRESGLSHLRATPRSPDRLTAGRGCGQDVRMQIGKPGEPVTHISRAYPGTGWRREAAIRPATSWGRLTFTETFHLLLTGRKPSQDERFLLDSAARCHRRARDDAETYVAARMTFVQTGFAARCSCGRIGADRVRHLRQACARLRAGAGRRRRPAPSLPLSRLASRPVRRCAGGGKVPGLRHPLHRPVHPWAERILELADERGVSGSTFSSPGVLVMCGRGRGSHSTTNVANADCGGRLDFR